MDKRADIWAFGVVLFEMLTGKRLFRGETVSDTIAAVLRREIDWTAAARRDAGSACDGCSRAASTATRSTRLRDIGEARVAVVPEEAAAAPARAVDGRARARRLSPWVAALGGVLLTLAGIVAGRMAPRTEKIQATPLVRFTLDTGQALLSASWHQFGGLAVSRDGQRLAWVASDGKVDRLYQRRMDSSRRARFRRPRERRIRSSPPTGGGSASSPTAC